MVVAVTVGVVAAAMDGHEGGQGPIPQEGVAEATVAVEADKIDVRPIARACPARLQDPGIGAVPHEEAHRMALTSVVCQTLLIISLPKISCQDDHPQSLPRRADLCHQ